jgi:AcrR family transcriptional regulator
METSAVPENGSLAGWRDRVVTRSLERATRQSLDRARGFIDATLELMQETGGDGFTLQDVADRAGQSLRTFYQHFPSKSELLLAVFEEEVEAHAEELKRSVDKYGDPLERIAAFVLAGATSADREGRTVALSQFRLNLAQEHPDEVAVAQAPVVQLARQLVADAVEAGAIPPCDPEPAAYMIVTLKSAYLHSKILGNELGVTLPDAKGLARFCLEGLNGRLPKTFE